MPFAGSTDAAMEEGFQPLEMQVQLVSAHVQG